MKTGTRVADWEATSVALIRAKRIEQGQDGKDDQQDQAVRGVIDVGTHGSALEEVEDQGAERQRQDGQEEADGGHGSSPRLGSAASRFGQLCVKRQARDSCAT
jgi:hypothetical protein